jgi:benzylsuccinate CoA-transferase BbsF subunit
MGSALNGVKVLDFSWVAAGPLVTTWMGQHGATIVRVESSKRPDTMRTGTPYKDGKPGINRSGYFALWNTDKYSLALDLKHPAARSVIEKLVIWADCVIENFTPGQMESWGFGYENLKQIKPDIVFLRLSMYGQIGHLARHLGFGPFLAGLVGFQNLTGWPDRGPVQVAGPTDNIAPDYALALLISALDRRNKTGQGEYIDVSQCEVSIQAVATQMLDYYANGNEANRMGNSCPRAAPHGVFRCQGEDRWCAIAVFTQEEWQSFCKVIGREELIGDARFATLTARKRNEETLNQLVESWTSQRSAEQVMTVMQSAGIAAGVVATAQDLLEDPQLRKRGRFALLNHSEIGPFYHLGEPFHLYGTPAEVRMAAPCLGEHTEFVCKGILHMSDDEFVTLLNQGIFQ